jgi:hypothetical protein
MKHNKPKPKDHKADREWKNQLRSEGQCFECESKDHMYKDCPKRHHTSKLSTSLHSASVDFVEVEHLKSLKDAQSLGLMAMSVISYQETREECVLKDQILMDRVILVLYSQVPLSFDNLLDGTSPFTEDRFHMYQISDKSFVITD